MSSFKRIDILHFGKRPQTSLWVRIAVMDAESHKQDPMVGFRYGLGQMGS